MDILIPSNVKLVLSSNTSKTSCINVSIRSTIFSSDCPVVGAMWFEFKITLFMLKFIFLSSFTIRGQLVSLALCP
jgi:hypothetical protein